MPSSSLDSITASAKSELQQRFDELRRLVNQTERTLLEQIDRLAYEANKPDPVKPFQLADMRQALDDDDANTWSDCIRQLHAMPLDAWLVNRPPKTSSSDSNNDRRPLDSKGSWSDYVVDLHSRPLDQWLLDQGKRADSSSGFEMVDDGESSFSNDF